MPKKYTHLFFIGLLFFLCSLSTIFAQPSRNLANHWYFGNQYGLDFSSGSPVNDTAHAMVTYEACCTMSDLNGDLLFYSNGGNSQGDEVVSAIWNKNHEIMEGGLLDESSGGGYSAAQGCIIFPKPGSDDRYCLFTIEEQEAMIWPSAEFPEGKGLNYFEIDMAANDGLGEVVIANQTIMEAAFEVLSATVHENCSDYWLVTHSANYILENDPDVTDYFHVFLVTENGISPPQTFLMPEGKPGKYDEYGLIKISPDGSQLTCGNFLYSFDNTTGAISDPTDLSLWGIDLEDELVFSPNSRFLYQLYFDFIWQTTYIFVKQYDLDQPDPGNNIHTVGSCEFPEVGLIGTAQIAPDGKIYFPIQSDGFFGTTLLSAIDHPNHQGDTAIFELGIINVSIGETKRFLRLGNFADNIFDFSPTIPFDLGPDMDLDCEDIIDFTLTGPTGFDHYLWSNGATSQSIEIDTEGTYWLNFSTDCEFGVDTVEVSFLTDLFSLDLGPDTLLCDDDLMALYIENIPDATYQWQDGSTDPVFIVSEPGQYVVSVNIEECVLEDSITIDYEQLPFAELTVDSIFCGTTPAMIRLDSFYGTSYEWLTDGISPVDPVLWISEEGTYGISVSNHCGTSIDTFAFHICDECQLFIPNAFSPNDDGNNDRFYPFFNCAYRSYHLQVFNRWGGLLFESTELENGWDGSYDGDLSPNGVYVYLLTCELETTDGSFEQVLKSGDVTIIR